MVKVGIAGVGAIGGAVARALEKGLDGYTLTAISDPHTSAPVSVPNVDFDELISKADLLIECLPPSIAPEFIAKVLEAGKDVIVISSAALLIHSELLDIHKQSTSRIIVPSGALVGLDGVNAMKNMNIKSAKIVSTKPPKGFTGAPYVEKMNIDVNKIDTKMRIFEGNALEAAKGFPANVNVAATLSLAGIGPEKTMVEIWADPATNRNTHEIVVETEFSTLRSSISNAPDPANPKSSVLAAQSIIAALQGFSDKLVVL
ncbi:MAG: aspartate dehydrogenase [Alphaproteobacteria bacterium]|nr:aspartate dehydrogenase [Alphaproteobacteria bacterium]MCD8526530.1 aspartate dehydrogenase [Alphaproteobacteria bacterium]MCD8570830.1 aspartate dehydrogenase [Alphaproteobacteria bacterium]